MQHESALIQYKPSVSKLKTKINILKNSDKAVLLERSKQLYQTIIEEDDDCTENKHIIQNERKDQILKHYNENAEMGIDEILNIHGLDISNFVTFLCSHIWNSQKSKSKNIDLTKIIKFLSIEEYYVMRLIDLLLLPEKQPITMLDLTMELCITPADAILILSMIWAELECEEIARLFEPYLSNPLELEITEEELKGAEEEFNQLLDMHLNLYKESNQIETKIIEDQFEKDLGAALEIINDQLDITDIKNEAKNLSQILCQMPEHSYRIETVISDSTEESESDDLEEDDIYVFTRKITSKWPHWLEDQLCQSNLDKHILLEPKQWYFAPIAEIFAHNSDAIKTEGYAKCQLLENNEDHVIIKGFIPPGREDGQSASSIITKIDRINLAMGEAPSIRCQEGTRVIAFSEQLTKNVGPWQINFFSGTIGVQPFSQNRFEYLIFFDNGIEAYVKPEDIRLLIDQPIDEKGNFMPRNAHTKIPFNFKERKEFIKNYLILYPDWPLIQLKKAENTQRVLATKNGFKESAFVLDIDRHLALLRFPGKIAWQSSAKECVIINCKEHIHVDEWVYRGNVLRFPTLNFYKQKIADKCNIIATKSTNLRKMHGQFEMAFPVNNKESYSEVLQWMQDTENKQTARKSAAKRQMLGNIPHGYAQKNLDKEMQKKKQLSMRTVNEKIPIPKWKYSKQIHQNCTPNCIQKINPVKMDSLMSAYCTPLFYGWTRLTMNLITEIKSSKAKCWAQKRIQYIAPCGAKLNNIKQVAKYLRATNEQRIEINNFTFDPQVRPNIRIKLENLMMDDFTDGQEAIKISLVNVVNEEQAPKITYRPVRTGVVKNMMEREEGNSSRKEIKSLAIRSEFCSGCSCTDNCSTNEKCECRQLTIESHNRLSESLRLPKSVPIGYYHRMLMDNHLSGVYECNFNCNCAKNLCPNRVVQQDLKIPLQLFMTAEKGWGVRTLVDIPTNTFVCTYSGELLDEKAADEHGKKFGDKYLADLNLVEAVEAEKVNQGIDWIGDEGFSEGEEGGSNVGIKNSRRPEELQKISKEDEIIMEGDEFVNAEGDEPSEIDEILREEVRKNHKKLNKKANQPWKSEEINAYFKGNLIFVVDAAMTGNIGRFLNHSCDPNCYIQNCFVDTHDLRLPWVAFFTTKFVKAGEELTWNYNYEVGSVKGKKIECHCGAPNCKLRLL